MEAHRRDSVCLYRGTHEANLYASIEAHRASIFHVCASIEAEKTHVLSVPPHSPKYLILKANSRDASCLEV